jgi:Ca-activated chloride channel homolog
MFYFNNPQALQYLWLVLILLVLVIVHRLWVASQLKKLPDITNGNFFTKKINSRFGWPQTIMLVGFALLVMAMAEPVSNNGNITQQSTGRQFIFCLDISNSMNAKDVAPSRLEAAKTLIRKIIEQHEGENFGLLVFAGNAYMDVPITDDITSILNNLSAINSDMAPTQGTAVAEALIAACNSFQDKLDGQKTIVLITDGEDHDSKINKALAQINEDEIYCLAVGLGTTNGAEALDEQGGAIYDENGKPVVSKLNESLLEQIAEQTNGQFEIFENNASLLNSLNGLVSQMKKGSSIKANKANLRHWYQLPLALAGVLFGLFFLAHYNKVK